MRYNDSESTGALTLKVLGIAAIIFFVIRATLGSKDEQSEGVTEGNSANYEIIEIEMEEKDNEDPIVITFDPSVPICQAKPDGRKVAQANFFLNALLVGVHLRLRGDTNLSLMIQPSSNCDFRSLLRCVSFIKTTDHNQILPCWAKFDRSCTVSISFS